MANGRDTQGTRLGAGLLQQALDASSTAVAISGPSLEISYVNQAFLRLWGYEREAEVLGRSTSSFWKDEAAAEDVARRLAWDGAWVGELVGRRADGSEFTARVTANLFHEAPGSPPSLVASFVDVSELRATEAALVRAQRMGRIGSWALVPATGAVTWSAEVSRIFGVPPDEPPSIAGFFSRIHPDDRDRVRDATTRGASGKGITYRVITPEGERVVFGVAEPVGAGPGGHVRLEGTVQDVTERVRLEEQLRQSQKMEAVGLLAGGVAHDFNNLLTVILTGAEFLEEALDPGDPRRADAEEILGAARRAEALTRQLLAFSRRQVQRPALIEPNEIVRGISKLMRRLIGEDVALTLSLPDGLPPFLGDGALVDQALMNLVVNAREAMPAGGRLAIATSVRELDEGAAQRLEVAPGRYVALTVTDSGRGMDDATRVRIFEPFFTTKPHGQGSGLGLSTVYGITRQAGGAVEVRTAPGQGASFTMLFPARSRDEATAGPPAKGAERGPPADAPVVLIAEDEPAVRSVAERCLRQHGYDVRTAPDGESALHAAKQIRRLDLLLTDVVMPGMNGRQLAEALTGVHPRTPVLFMTGYTDDTVLRLGIEANQVRILSKPFTPDALVSAVAEAMGRPAGGAAPAGARVKTSE